ncbi:MAG: PEP-CTERM sorting domain-containing protein [Pirellulales bacterium]|nr:PEP-CTERM sorting domain-containing protein [Pirellulales bacterium]
MSRLAPLAVVLLSCVLCSTTAASTIVFFNSSQVATPVASGVTSDTISSEGYLFTYTRDKLFTGGIGLTEPIGRPVLVTWPQGVEAQAVTAGPSPGNARITIERVDGGVFDLTAFSAKLLANTAGAGGSFEIVPFLNGQEVLSDPVVFDATGISGNVFSYDTSPNPWGSTKLLTGFDKYRIDLYVDFALVGLTVEGAAVPEPSTLGLAGLGAIGLAIAGCRGRLSRKGRERSKV